MTFLPTLTASVAAAVLALGPLSQQPPATPAQQPASKPAVVSLIGCVERVATPTPTPPAAGTAQPASQRPAYKLIDVQPGPGTTTSWKTDSQFLLSVSPTLTTPIDFGKFQNQWVEVTGTMSPGPAAKVTPQPTPTPKPTAEPAPLLTFTTASVKMISTECK